MACTVLLIRHGQSRHNADGNAFSGVTDVQMNDAGRDQCRELSAFFRVHSVERVFTSPLQRARESARLVFPDRQDTVSVLDWLTEFNYGDYEGMRADDAPDDPVIRQWNTSPADLTFPGGDSVREHAHRTYDAFATFVRTLTDNSRVVCVTHRTTIRLLVAHVLQMDLNRFRDVPCANCAVTEFLVDAQGKPFVQALNVSLDYTGTPAAGGQ